MTTTTTTTDTVVRSSPWPFRIAKIVALVILATHLLFAMANGARTANAWMDLVSASAQGGIAAFTIGEEEESSTTPPTGTTPATTPTNAASEPDNNEGPDNKFRFAEDPVFGDVRAPVFHESIPLEELVATGGPSYTEGCPSSDTFTMSVVPDTILETSVTHPTGRNIPKVVHVTGKTRCLTGKVRRNLDLWRLANHSFYFHDDAAVDRLLAKYVPAFPHLQIATECSISGAAKADIWRYLVLWEYGGIYTDLDNAPGIGFANGTAITDDDEAWFVVERGGIPSQYFFAATPKHPILHVAMMQCLSRLTKLVDNIGDQYVPFITGPGVTKAAMMLFTKNSTLEEVHEGLYRGLDGRTVTIKGSRKHSNRIVQRESVSGKHGHYHAMGMQHFSTSKNQTWNESCYEHLFRSSSRQRGREGAPPAGAG